MSESSSCPLEAQRKIQRSYHSEGSRRGHFSVKEHSLATDEEHKRHQTSSASLLWRRGALNSMNLSVVSEINRIYNVAIEVTSH